MAIQSKKINLFRHKTDARKFSFNATAHLSDEEFSQYTQFIYTMVSHFQPEGDEEEMLARTVAETMFQIDVISSMETMILLGMVDEELMEANPLLKKVMRSKCPLLAISRYSEGLLGQLELSRDLLNKCQEERRNKSSKDL